VKNEGTVKYSAQHTPAAAMTPPLWKNLNDVRTRLHDLYLLGVRPDGIAFGNVSMRMEGNQFLISGTSTGAEKVLGADKYCLVTSIDIAANTIISRGPIPASSESMTHGAIYEACPLAKSVIHIHDRKIFDGMRSGRCLATPPDAEYGTPEIARAIAHCVTQSGKSEGVIVLAGHDEGLIAYSGNPDKAFDLIQTLYNKYHERGV
jgi:ribulose-5-phosphate 4-epimerase/fuculose-1-phosphate aldolase